MLQNKKGISEQMTRLFYIFLTVIIAGVIIRTGILYFNEDFAHVPDQEALILSAILRNNCLAVKDDLKTYMNVIDPAKITQERLKGCYHKESLGYEVTLQSLSGFAVASASVLSSAQKYYLPICKAASASQYACTSRKEYVLYQKDKERVPGVLSIKVINRVQ